MSQVVGFFLYANGAYVAELLTYKQLPRIVYNKSFQGCVPTLGQTVELGDVSYGKEVHSVEKYPGYGGSMCRASGTAAVVLRGTDPMLVPLMLPSREVRLYDRNALAVFGRRAGVMMNKVRTFGIFDVRKRLSYRPRVKMMKRQVSKHPAGGTKSRANLLVNLNWRVHPYQQVRSKYWLSGYILRGKQYQKFQSVADIKSKTYSWASRDKVYR